MNVTARDQGGKVVYRGTTDKAGKFSTPQLAPGKYVFEFAGKGNSGFQVALAGPKSAKQTKGSGAGLAFNVDVAPAAKVSGQATGAAGVAQGNEKLPPNVRIINGKRYVLVSGELGSNMGGKWIPEEDAHSSNPNSTRKNASEFLQRNQDMGGQGAASGR